MMNNVDLSPTLSAASTTLHSSESLGWSDITVEHIQLQADELYVPPLEHHRICMILGNDFMLEQVRNGKMFVHNFRRGQAQLLPAKTEGVWRFRQSVQVLHLEFSPIFVRQIAAETTHIDPARVGIIDQFLLHDPQVEHISFALFAELLDGGQNGQLYSGALATALAAHLLQKYGSISSACSTQPKTLSRIAFQQVLDYIDSHLAEDIALPTLAQTVNVSTSHFTALFKQNVGSAPYQYILNQRVQRAKSLLLHSNLTVAQVASEVGFYDQSHLTRHMRRLLKITPAALQRQRNVQNPR